MIEDKDWMEVVESGLEEVYEYSVGNIIFGKTCSTLLGSLACLMYEDTKMFGMQTVSMCIQS
jgi:hypothetical protein